MKPLEARDLASEELQDKLRELKEQQFDLRFQLATGQLDNHRRLRNIRRDMAMMRTILRERELAEEDELAAATSTEEPSE